MNSGGDALGLERSPCKLKVVKTGSDCHGFAEMNIINGRPAKRHSLFNGHECRAQIEIYSPSSVIVRSPYEWKILDWEEKPQTK